MANITSEKCKIPQRFESYLEKHRIYELFEDLAAELVVQRPADHITFLRQALKQLRDHRDRPRIIILAPPHIDMERLAEGIHDEIGAVPVTRADIDALSRQLANPVHEESGATDATRAKTDAGSEQGRDSGQMRPTLRPFSSYEFLRAIPFLIRGSIVVGIPEYETSETSSDLSTDSLSEQVNEEEMDPETFGLRVYEILKSSPFLQNGWILEDFPKTYEEAVALQHAGVYPTHVIQLVPSVLSKTETLTSEAAMKQSRAQTVCGIKDYRCRILPLREAYRNVIQEMDVRGLSKEEVCRHIALQVRLRAPTSAPFLPRLVVLGLRASGNRRLARLLTQRFDMVHVDFDEVVRQALQEKPELMSQTRAGQQTDNNLINAIIEEKLLSWTCLSYGWVLTGFPRTVQEFKMLDLTDTPPNRVVLLDISPKVSLERTSNTRYNVDTESRHNLLSSSSADLASIEISSHPDDMPHVVQQQIAATQAELEAIVEYCGASLTVIDGDQSERKLFEMLKAVLSRPSPAAPPRKPLG